MATWVKYSHRKVKSFRYLQAISSGVTGATDDTSYTNIGDVSIWVDTSNMYLNFTGDSSDLSATNGIMLTTQTLYPVNIHSSGIINLMSTSTGPRVQIILWE